MSTSKDAKVNQSSQDIFHWNNVAQEYIDSRSDPRHPMYLQIKDVLWESLGDLNDCNVLDLGCGHGWISQKMSQRGAKVIGIDGSDKLLEYARSHNPDIEFIQSDLAYGVPAQDQKFDRIVSTMALMDIADLELLLRDVGKLLTGTGRFVFVILHPCFCYKLDFDELSQEWYRKVTKYQDPFVVHFDSFGGHNHYHRNLTYYADLLRANDLAITRLYEPDCMPGPGHPDGNKPQVLRQWPMCLLIEARPLPM